MGRASRSTPKYLHWKLSFIRGALGLTQDGMLARLESAGITGLYRSSISGYELGTREPPLKVLLEYARTANVSVEALIDDELDLPDKLPAKRKSEGVKRKFSIYRYHSSPKRTK